MPNTNFQTFHQMGQAINEVVRQATGRDNVQNIDMEHITVAQNHYYQDVDVSGGTVSFNAGKAGIPLEKLLVKIEPVQEGSGDPSPDNVRPITGWTGANVYVSPTTDAADGQTYSITFPSEAGTVYGGTLTVNEDGTGTLVVDRFEYTFTGDETFSTEPSAWGAYAFLYNTGVQIRSSIYSSSICKSSHFVLTSEGGWGSLTPGKYMIAGNTYIGLGFDGTKEELKAWLSSQASENTPVQVVCGLKTPVTYQLSNPEVIVTLKGVNNIWSDTGDIEVKFKDLKELY